jgi:phospholipid transport system substrate-binding protein
MRHRRLASTSIALALLLFAAARGVFAAEDVRKPGTAVVEQLQNALLDAMKKGEQLDVKARYALLEPVITEAHDFDFVAPRVFGDAWQKLTDEQKKTVLDLYRQAAIMTFAQQFNAYQGEQFRILDEQATSRGTRVVRSEMLEPSGKTVHFDYLLHNADGKWRIINTSFDGVSGMSMDRARYQSVLEQRGVDALITLLRQRPEASPEGEQPG